MRAAGASPEQVTRQLHQICEGTANTPSRRGNHHGEMAVLRSRRMRPFCPWTHFVISIDTIWLATEPLDMRAGTETALTRVIVVCGAAQPHCAFLFANRSTTCIKVLVHNGFGVWLAARRLSEGKFHWPPLDMAPKWGSVPSSFRRW